ncbi:MAG: 30S ribosomal protein S6 [Candidatus Schekmanbacteria bacterium RBG_16_38_10]|uniref:Small ribosomal subunit protein bS6 n=1 Tax=Candidatus Schekmanbacteria bacterium RBG_16_38_10 TaxID=1817879 RepID=A0A1F7S1L8_9BACT|nr:MAG: 30S ribosomal protein S6 [Candidatus Schekmanbacteria bacterium RBG_16_38_10]
MKLYEILYIVRPDINEDTIDGKILSKFKQVIEKHNGEILKTEKWGLRKLAYNIKKYEDGYYVLNQVKGDPALVTEIERNLQIDESILRYMTISLEENDLKKNITVVEIPKEDEI